MKNQDFDLKSCVNEYHSYIKHLIFPDEVVSVSFMLFDFEENTLQSAIFGMPLSCYKKWMIQSNL